MDSDAENRAVWKLRVAESEGSPTQTGSAQNLPPLVWEILSARGFKTEEEMQRWLSPSLKDLRDPFTLKEMDKAVARLAKAYELNEKICVYCDYDLDGTSACAMLKQAFDQLGFKDFVLYQPKRLTEGYGLHKAAIQKLADQGVKLILTADLGITAIEETEFAKKLGVDMIITDHHLPKEKLPDAVAVVNPNRGNCESNLGHLCGTGVAFYLILALRRTLLERGIISSESAFDPKSLLDCFAIGTLTDMVPLKEENRVLVKHGLLTLAQTQRPGLRSLLQALKLWGIPLTSQDVAIRFAPKLNALSRMETGIQPLDIYLATDPKEAERLVTEVLSNNQMRQVSQKDAETEAFQKLQASPPGPSAFVWSKNFHRGVVGLVATKIVQEMGIPAFVGSMDEHGRIVGSARMPEGMKLSLLDALESAQDILTQFGGHAVACGFEMEEVNAPALAERLTAWFQAKNQDAIGSEWIYDAECSLTDLNPQFMQWYEHMGPFGAKYDPPIFLLKRVQVSQVQILKGGHLRLTFAPADSCQSYGSSKGAIWFGPPKAFLNADSDQALRPGALVDILVEPQWNYFQGRKQLQLLVHDLRLA